MPKHTRSASPDSTSKKQIDQEAKSRLVATYFVKDNEPDQ